VSFAPIALSEYAELFLKGDPGSDRSAVAARPHETLGFQGWGTLPLWRSSLGHRVGRGWERLLYLHHRRSDARG
jgi:hypothetical protein